MRRHLLAAVLAIGAWPVHAQDAAPPRLSFPVACEIGRTCMVQNYFDHDAGPGARDYRCGRLTYDKHEGTDIRLPNLAAMRKGVQVLAAADGTVRAIRNNMEDVNFHEIGKAAIANHFAGNAVVLVHPGGWETQYSHMRKGSVMVKPGDTVRRGQPLGLIGLSGLTEFPHLHISVRLNGKPLDPFVGRSESHDCDGRAEPLWDADAQARLAYVPTGLLAADFSGAAPTFAQVKDGRTASPQPASAALVFWINAFGVQAGDEERLRVLAPDGQVLSDSRRSVPADKAEWFSYTGKKRTGASWPPGRYRGEYTLTRKGADGPRTVLSVAREAVIPNVR
jgi:hypothetical protein